MGVIQLARRKTSTAFTDPLFAGTSPNPSAFALALFSGLWAYEGWDQGRPPCPPTHLNSHPGSKLYYWGNEGPRQKYAKSYSLKHDDRDGKTYASRL